MRENPFPEPKIAAAYIRVSTDDQAEYSPDAQLAEIRKYAAAHGYVIPNEFIFLDEGISGKHTDKRPEFNRMIGMAKQKPRPFDAILLWKFSRFARNREDSIVYKSMLRRELGIDVISISEPLADDKMSIIMEAMIEAMDEYYSLNLAEEVKRGMTEKARRGGLQSTPSFGYRVENNVLVPIPEEAALIRSIFDRFIAGEGLFPIAKWLNDMGVKTHRGNRFENRTVEYILRNPVYIGKMRWNPTGRTRRDFSNENIILADAKHEPLISQDTWDAAQRRMAAVKAQWKYHGRPITEHKRWLSGLVRCADCGSTLIFAAPHYWKCNGYVRGRCKSTQHIADEKLTEMLLTLMERDTQVDIPISYSIARPRPEAVDESALLKEQRSQLDAKLDRLREAYLSGVEDLSSYAAAKAALEERAAQLDQRIQALSSPTDKKAADLLMKEQISRCLEILRDPASNMEQKHSAAHGAIDRCTFSKADNSLRIFYRLFLP
ncbi:recombinase family protein [uncultured Flavonifractor sp.]|uniref:recombinase family protein n=1 Tax=uncultured Flavonifractor sp. TaxID=1193534 RepID=UPI002607E32B|nr:recombinase family protein [uncultured Flavonifractor sp.]